MSEDKILDHIDPERREFMKRLLIGAAFVTPVVATFSIDALTAHSAYAGPSANISNTTNITNQVCVGDVGYVGPTNFQAHVSVGPIFAGFENQNRVNGQATFTIESKNSPVEFIVGSVTLVPGAQVLNVSILVGPLAAVTLPGQVFEITNSNLQTRVVCDLDELADMMASGGCFCSVQGLYGGRQFTAVGPIVAAPAQP